MTARGAVINRMEGCHGQVEANRMVRQAARSARKGVAAGTKAHKPGRHGRRAAKPAPHASEGGTKQARVIALLAAATGWLPHTTRAALTGLRHKGFALDKSKRQDGTTVYRISSAPVAGKVG